MVKSGCGNEGVKIGMGWGEAPGEIAQKELILAWLQDGNE